MLDRPRAAVYLVTGASGFLGRPLLDALAGSSNSPFRIVTVGRRRPTDWPADSFIQGDLTNLESVRAVIEEADPAVVFHLAGRTPPADPGALYESNSVATALLLDALRERGRPARVVLAGSAAELGPVAVEALPVDESHPCRPESPYGLSKWLASCAGLAARLG